MQFRWMILPILMGLTGANAQDARTAEISKKLVGTWQLKKATVAGTALPETVVKALRLELTESKYLVTGAESPDEGTWRLYPDKKPLGLDVKGTNGPNKGNTLLAIVECSGDTLRVCYDLSGQKRPTAFESKPGALTFLAEYERVKTDKEGFIELLNGKDLDGWKASENPQTFKIEEGKLVVNGPRAHLYYMGPVRNHNFKNFHLRAEVLTFPQANSGIYFHTEFQPSGWPDKGFESQVNETHGDVKKTGGLYNVKDVLNQSPARNNEWYTYDIIVKDKTITVKIDGKTTCEWTQPADWKSPPGHPHRILGSGTIAIQGHDPGSKVLYRSIKIKPLD